VAIIGAAAGGVVLIVVVIVVCFCCGCCCFAKNKKNPTAIHPDKATTKTSVSTLSSITPASPSPKEVKIEVKAERSVEVAPVAAAPVSTKKLEKVYCDDRDILTTD
jgi:hypothetical protein